MESSERYDGGRMVYTNRRRCYCMDVDCDWMSDIIPMEIPMRNQIRVYILCGMVNIIWRLI